MKYKTNPDVANGAKNWVQKHFSPQIQMDKWKHFIHWMMTRETEGGF